MSRQGDTADLFAQYAKTVVTVELPGTGWVGAHEAALRLENRIFVLTAWNPGAARPGDDANRSANQLLYARLIEGASAVYPALGSSASGDHAEESFAVVGLGQEDATVIGSEFGQAAIFELTPTELIVHSSDGSRAPQGIRLPRTRQAG